MSIVESKKNKGIYLLKNVVVNYPYVFTPNPFVDSEKKLYTVEVLIPKSDVETHTQFCMLTKKHELAVFGNSSKLSFPIIKDGDDQRDLRNLPSSKPNTTRFNHWYMRLKTIHKPYVKDVEGNTIEDSTLLYSGAIVNVWFTFNFYLNKRYKGCFGSLNLIAIQKIGKGKPLGRQIELDDDEFIDNGKEFIDQAPDRFDDLDL